MADEMVTFFAARRGLDSDALYVRLGPGDDYPWWVLDMVAGVTELPEPTREVRIVTTDPEPAPTNHDWVEIGERRLCAKHEPDMLRQALSELAEARSVIAQMSDESPAGDDKRDALAWASGQFAPVGIEDAHAIGDAVLYLAGSYLTWLGRDGSVPDA